MSIILIAVGVPLGILLGLWIGVSNKRPRNMTLAPPDEEISEDDMMRILKVLSEHKK